jgi:hypothetical protein
VLNLRSTLDVILSGRGYINSAFLEENRRIIESKGGKIVAGIHGFGGIDGTFRSRLAAMCLQMNPPELIYH